MDRVCSSPGCDRVHYAKGLCKSHHERRRRGDLSTATLPATIPTSSHPLYSCYANILKRLDNPNNPRYQRYGGRGITLHPRWRADPQSFIDWVEANLGPKPEGWSLDRIDNDGNYEPGNLRWASPKTQQNNIAPALAAQASPMGGVRQKGRRWTARLHHRYLGTFDTAEEARAAVTAAWETAAHHTL